MRVIAFERGQDTTYIYIARTDGTGQRRVTEGSSAIWAPSGDEIAFIGANSRRHYYDAVVRMRLDGSGRRVLYRGYSWCGCITLDWVSGSK